MRFLSSMVALALSACAHDAPPATAQSFDAALAQRFGADERGMRQYVLVILRTGPYTPASEEERNTLFEGHFANINRRAEEGKLLVAGPLGNNERQYRGIFIFNVATIEEAQALVSTDPSIERGVFVAEFYPWYGSAALVETPAIHRRVTPPSPQP